MSSNDQKADPPVIRKPIAVEDVPWEEWSEGSRFGSRYRHLTKAAVGDGYHVGVQIEELLPGKQSSPAHYHLLEEEHILILEGRATLRLGEETIEVSAGDYVCFPARQKAGHCLVNTSDALCRFLVIGERKPDEVCVYTDSNKILVRSVHEVYDKSQVRDYWDGEETGGDQASSPSSSSP
ncbi:cupin [Sorangium cellulosum]|uniref:Cupin n=1 Tax=Sorangium cellulosum TaxID=56 RepID=A0A2L0EHK0_SORCE|nr:cupin domain-containing protein [Sorangium cellulosum]AUX38763.1 cupin [Sorangium cellulosum]